MAKRAAVALRLVHYWWPLALGWSVSVVVRRATGQGPSPWGLTALLTGIVAAYSLDRALDPPARGVPSWLGRLLVATGGIAALACGAAAWHLPFRIAVLVPVLGLAALLYTPLKRLPAVKSLALPLIWTWASLALPFGRTAWLGWDAVRLPVAAPVLLLIASGCMLCDLKDEAEDRRDGVPSVPALVGRAATVRLALLLAVAGGALALAEHRTGLLASACALGLATVRPSFLATEVAGPLLVDVILTLPGILISARLV